jgi:hypothetical protein
MYLNYYKHLYFCSLKFITYLCGCGFTVGLWCQKMEKRQRSAKTPPVGARLGDGLIMEFDVESPIDLIENRKKYNWKRFSFLGVLVFVICVVIVYCGKPTAQRHHLKHDYILEATGQLLPIGAVVKLESDGGTAVVPRTDDTPPQTPTSTTIPAISKNEAAQQLIEQIRALKRNGVVIETSPDAQELIGKLQPLLREVLLETYGPEPYHVEMLLEFPESMPDYSVSGKDGRIVIELAPSALVPYCVYYFLNIVDNWKVF